MKLRLLSLLLLISGVVHGQTPAGYIKANMRFKWTAGIFDSALHVPQYNGTPSGIRNGAWVGDGAVAVDTVNNLFYFRSSGAWHQTSSGAGWLLTGNSGTTSSNFIGTTDDQPLSFRVNNRWAGRLTTSGNIFWGDSAGVNNIGYSNVAIGRGALRNDVGGINLVAIGDSALYNNLVDVETEEGLQNTAVGSKALYSNTTGSYNTANGTYSLSFNTTGSNNTANGLQSLYSNTTGSYNTANGTYSLFSNTTGSNNTANGLQSLFSNTTGHSNTANGYQSLYNNTTGNSNTVNGYYSLFSNTTGDNNVGIGYQSGYHTNQKTDAKNQILIGAGTYGTRDSIAVIGANFMKETILRGKLIDSTLSAGVGTKAVRWNGSTGEFTYADTTVGGGGSPAGSNKELQFNNSGAFGGTTGIKYGNASNERLTIWQTTSTDVPLTIKVEGDNSKAAIEIKDTTGSPYTSAIKFTPSGGGSPGASYIMQGYNGLILSAGNPPYLGSRDALVSIGISSVQNAFFRSYPYDVPDSPNNWVAKIRTAKTSAIGLAIDWGAAGQTGDLLQFRNNSSTVLASVTSAGNIKAPAPTYSSGGYKFLVRNSTSSQFESIDPLVGSSTYTPTTSGLTNVDSTHVFECQYSWITDATTGLKTVTVSGQVEVYINSANTDSRVILSLPVASSFANEYEAGGTGGVTTASNGLSNHRYSIGVKANTISEAAEFVFNPTSGSCNAKINFSFHYKVNTP
jgi:hypothetical protein